MVRDEQRSAIDVVARPMIKFETSCPYGFAIGVKRHLAERKHHPYIPEKLELREEILRAVLQFSRQRLVDGRRIRLAVAFALKR